MCGSPLWMILPGSGPSSVPGSFASFPAAFLDIYMTGATGMECARLLREFDSQCQLIFTTTSTDHAPESFQVRAMD